MDGLGPTPYRRVRILRDMGLIALGFILMALFIKLHWVVDFTIFCILVLSFDLIYGYLGRLTFGHMLYYGVGGYVASLILVHLSPNPFLAMLGGTLAALVLAATLGFIVIQTHGAPFALVNLAFNQIGYWLAASGLQKYTRGEDGLSSAVAAIGFLDFTKKPILFGFVLACLLLVFWLLKTFTLSPYGLLIRSVKENEDRVKFLGYDTFRPQWLTFVLSGALAGFAGTLFSICYGFISPSIINPLANVEVIFAVLIGGAGNLYGAIIGGVVFKLISNYLATAITRWEMLLGAFLLILVFRFRRGVSGSVQDLWLRFSRKKALEGAAR